MKRRKFISDSIKVATIGAGLSVVSGLKSFAQSSSPTFRPVTIDAFNQDFQQDVKRQKKTFLAVQNQVNGLKTPYTVGGGLVGTDNEMARKFLNVQKYNRQLGYGSAQPVTPAFRLNTNTGHNIEGQIFKSSETGAYSGIYKGVRRYNGKVSTLEEGDMYVLHPAFHEFIGHQEYFCYGTPCTDPYIHYCKKCGEEYVFQGMHYSGHSLYDGRGEYKHSQFYQFYAGIDDCGNVPGRLHDELTISDARTVVPCCGNQSIIIGRG